MYTLKRLTQSKLLRIHIIFMVYTHNMQALSCIESIIIETVIIF